ncbi:unnamed protein product [Gongylonema pulchrum]|uniref:Pept_C1 domain-containing protein n=1 Tax=Gongylonema pulchrum TaxID=637853 RepID=A0A183DZX6_9BILA|nr:unnamed protein product [Gongylonema pulchrum]
MAAWRFWVTDGIVTGSNYSQHGGCRPYPFPPCEHHSNKTHYQPCKHDLYPTPKCDKKCISGYGKSYKADKYYGKQYVIWEICSHVPMSVPVRDSMLHVGGPAIQQKI